MLSGRAHAYTVERFAVLLLVCLPVCRRRVTVSEFRGVWYVGVREFYEQVRRVQAEPAT